MRYKTISTIYRALEHYKHWLESLKKEEEVKKKFPKSMFSDINEEIEKIEEIMEEFKEPYENESSSRFTSEFLQIHHETMFYALDKYQQGLEELKDKIEEDFSDSPIELTQITEDLEDINRCKEVLEGD